MPWIPGYRQTSSSGLTTSSQKFCKSYSSCCSILSDTHTVPLVLSQNRRINRQNCDSELPSPLPSDFFKYVSWCDIEEHDVQGNLLHCPRVREGPSEEELFFRGEEHTLKKGKQKTDTEKWQKKLQENWEDCTDLGDLYQVGNFKRILQRLIRVEKLWLVDNSLTDLSAIRLPRCRELNVNKNHITSFKQLPRIPQIQHLSLAENNIMTLSGISDFRHTPLESLILKRNPCEFQERYRKLVFSSLPNLKMLDGIPKLPEDCSSPDNSFFFKTCTIL
ncbi:leucine-rich repeat-containing protein 46-like isoform X3 [Neopsephotus bourkii]|uniref:leucine-rich repeat-containing protein 46-like isoform X3 n=1 Tax=Neopsephotus bourkii TaxID=309878 RepID=UPI002AA54D88|nr:leucine-rich repeat-containing protein 46-like isoform X3 [Neopsephotus bourkii]